LGARVRRDRVEVLRRAAALRHVAKPVTRGEVEGRMLLVSQDSSGARLVRRCAAGSGSPRPLANLAATLTVFHLKIGFVRSDRTGYPREARLGRRSLLQGARGPELGQPPRRLVLTPRTRERIKRHEALCAESLKQEPHASFRPGLRGLTGRFARDGPAQPEGVGYAASPLRAPRGPRDGRADGARGGSAAALRSTSW
jgi:poly(A) polymerase